MRHHAQKVFRGIFIGILQHQKGYLVYVTHKFKIVSSYGVFFDEIFSSDLAYTSQPYSEAMIMQPAVLYIPYATYSKEQTGYIIMFTQFEGRNLLSEYCNGMESGDESDDSSTLPPFIIEAKMHEMLSVDESNAEPMSIDMLEGSIDGIQYHSSNNRR